MDPPPQAGVKSIKTQRLERAGYADMGFEVQANFRLSKSRDKKGVNHYHTEIIDCRISSDMDGQVLTDSLSNFQCVASLVFENDADEWE